MSKEQTAGFKRWKEKIVFFIYVEPDKTAMRCSEMAGVDKCDENTTWGQRNNSGPSSALDMGVGISDVIPDQPGQV